MYLKLKESKMQKIQYELYGTSVLKPMQQSTLYPSRKQSTISLIITAFVAWVSHPAHIGKLAPGPLSSRYHNCCCLQDHCC